MLEIVDELVADGGLELLEVLGGAGGADEDEFFGQEREIGTRRLLVETLAVVPAGGDVVGSDDVPTHEEVVGAVGAGFVDCVEDLIDLFREGLGCSDTFRTFSIDGEAVDVVRMFSCLATIWTGEHSVDVTAGESSTYTSTSHGDR